MRTWDALAGLEVQIDDYAIESHSVLWAGVALVAFGFLGRAIGRAGDRLAAEGPSPELALRMRNLVWLSRGLLLTLVVIAFLMVAKPGT